MPTLRAWMAQVVDVAAYMGDMDSAPSFPGSEPRTLDNVHIYGNIWIPSLILCLSAPLSLPFFYLNFSDN